MKKSIRTFAFIVGGIGFFSSLALADGSPRAYVLIGYDEGGYTGDALSNAANLAKSDYENAGYTVIRINKATTADWRRALNDPKARAIWFAGHGVYNSQRSWFGLEKLGDVKEGLVFTDGPKMGPTGPHPNIRQVTLHACGQDQKSWRNSFPNADFDSWSTSMRAWQVYWWQWGATYDRIKDSSFPVPRLHETLEQANQFYNREGFWVYDLDPVSNDYSIPGVASFVLNAQLQAQLNGATFNFMAFDGPDHLQLFAVPIAGGVIDFTNQSDQYDPNADFDVMISNDAMFNLLENPSLWLSYSGDPNAVRLFNRSGISDATVLEGVGVVVFGVPEPGTLLALGAGLAVLLRRRKGRNP